MRLFVALSLPEPLRARLVELQRGLPGARWVGPENLHLTLCFIGEADDEEARDLDAALARVDAARFPVTLAGVDHFGQGRRLRALWVGVAPNAALDRLHRKVARALRAAGLAPEGRRFKPHVTLARFKGDPGGGLPDYLAHHATFRAAAFEARDFVLYSSFLSRDGAIHTPEAVYPLDTKDRPLPLDAAL